MTRGSRSSRAIGGGIGAIGLIGLGLYAQVRACQGDVDERYHANIEAQRQRLEVSSRPPPTATAPPAVIGPHNEAEDRAALRWLATEYIPRERAMAEACEAVQSCFFDAQMARFRACLDHAVPPCEAAIADLPVSSAPPTLRLALQNVADSRRGDLCGAAAAREMLEDRAHPSTGTYVDWQDTWSDDQLEASDAREAVICDRLRTVADPSLLSVTEWVSRRFTYPDGGCWDSRLATLPLVAETAIYGACRSFP